MKKGDITFLPQMLQMQELEVEAKSPGSLFSVFAVGVPFLTHEHPLIIKMDSKASGQTAG